MIWIDTSKQNFEPFKLAKLQESLIQLYICISAVHTPFCVIHHGDGLLNRAVTVAVTTSVTGGGVVGCHRGCVLPPVVAHVTSHTL